jgi:uncharacterized membrane protein YkoI
MPKPPRCSTTERKVTTRATTSRALGLLPLLACLLFSSAASGRDIGPGEALELRKKKALMPLETILVSVSERYPDSRLLEVELEEEKGRFIYEVEILTHRQQIRELEIDAGDGTIIKDELED